MKSYFAYIRVSTAKQGEHGSSLQEQRQAIELFASRNGLTIAAWFEERETAAKVGRHEFSRMMRALKRGIVSGVIFHKIDRSARNLKDWSLVQDLAESGVDVRFAHESVNLASNEGKLTGDFLAVIASHYIRNLRDEVKKGIRGRLKQGLYPFAAPLGYLDQGGGKAKVPDPVRAPFVRQAFEIYATGRRSLRALSDELYEQGLRSKAGQKINAKRLAEALHNPFYIGIIRIGRSKEVFPGVHQPLISRSTFEHVQAVLSGKAIAKVVRHDFLFRRLLQCSGCTYHLSGELQKGHVYYRCHTPECPTRTVREEGVHRSISSAFEPLSILPDEVAELREMVDELGQQSQATVTEQLRAIMLQLDNIQSRLSRVADLYIDGALPQPLFEQKKLALLAEQKDLEQRRERLLENDRAIETDIRVILERAQMLPLSYETGTPGEKREILESVTSNLLVDGKDVVVKLRSPFLSIAQTTPVSDGGPTRRRPRTRARKIFRVLLRHCLMDVREGHMASRQTRQG